MIRLARFLRRRSRAVAALEFALAAPVMLIFLGGVVDFGLAFYDKSRVAAGVAAGAEYALLNAATVIANAASEQSTTIPNFVKNAAGLTSMQVPVTGLNPTACYCITGSPPAKTATTCGNTCSDGSKAGTYVFITASYTYHPILPIYSGLTNHTIWETATVQIK